MNVSTSSAANAAATSLVPAGRADKILIAGRPLLAFLERGQPIVATDLRISLTNAFGGSDSEGFWSWKDAYEATEVAQVLFLIPASDDGQAVLSRLIERHRIVDVAGRG